MFGATASHGPLRMFQNIRAIEARSRRRVANKSSKNQSRSMSALVRVIGLFQLSFLAKYSPRMTLAVSGSYLASVSYVLSLMLSAVHYFARFSR